MNPQPMVRVVLCALIVVSGAGVWAVSAPGQGGGAGPAAGSLLVYFGTYTSAKSQGVYVARLDLATGALTEPTLAAGIVSPSFLAVHPKRTFLYAVNEVSNFDGGVTGAVSAFRIDRATGRLTLLNQQSSGGAGPAHLTVDRAGRNVLVANYGGGSVAVLPIGADGRLDAASAFVQHAGSSVNPQRQQGPHAHSVNVDLANRFAFVADLGLDKVLIYRFDPSKGSIVPNDPPAANVEPGSGPRHFAFHPTGRFAYVINEMTCTVTAFACDASAGRLETLQTISTLPDGVTVAKGMSTAEVQVHPSGRFVYGSNRGHDSITVFAVDETTGRLTFVQNESTQGSTPRNFGIDPTGRYLLAANQRTDSVVVFRIDEATGRLTPTGTRITVGSPVCVKFVE
jgi:6-phosphogluconolactonase